MNAATWIGLAGALVAALLGVAELRKLLEARRAQHRLDILNSSPEQRTSVIVSSAETAAVVLRNALERADFEIKRKDAYIASLEERVRSLEASRLEQERKIYELQRSMGGAS